MQQCLQMPKEHTDTLIDTFKDIKMAMGDCHEMVLGTGADKQRLNCS